MDYLRTTYLGQPDWLNLSYDRREAWLVWPWPEPRRAGLWQRFAQLLGRLGGHTGFVPPDREPDAARSRA